MQRHFHEELEALKQTLLAMGGLVEDQIRAGHDARSSSATTSSPRRSSTATVR